jgi:hypothetical protein
MTCREKLKMKHPEKVDDQWTGGCYGCPWEHDYLPEPDYCKGADEYTCTKCWDREIPESRPVYAAGECLGKVKDIIEENGGITAIIEPSIKDSGDRTEFGTGAVRDMREGKGRCDLMPLEVVAEYFRLGKYAPDPKRSEDIYWTLRSICDFKRSNYTQTTYLYSAMSTFGSRAYDYTPTMFLEVAKHFEEGAKKYGENNWQKGIPVHCYIDSAVRHYLKWLRGDKDEPHDRAFVWNLMCCIWEVDYREKEEII